MMFKAQISVKNFFRQKGEPAFGPWEDLTDETGNLVIMTEDEVFLDKEFNQIDSMHTRYEPIAIGE